MPLSGRLWQRWRCVRCLDLFCGGGGVSMGYAAAGFDVVGVDINPQPRYPFEFIQADALEYLAEHGKEFDFIHASPPCQGYSVLVSMTTHEHPKMITPTRELLRATGRPYVIENVAGARRELIDPIMLCGAMFGLRSYRHRLFESNVPLTTPEHPKHTHGVKYIYDKRKSGYRQPFTATDMVPVHGDNNAPFGLQCEAMGIDWMNRRELVQAIPPAFTEYIGRQVMESIVKEKENEHS
jgi:DNA (cytosine-5)-methyltransferase 1